ncbi:MAG: hypothetical protein IT162_17170 [Bryobacterales bacterium]|nr:hypothetical protein [Bryobacterales bacterium]
MFAASLGSYANEVNKPVQPTKRILLAMLLSAIALPLLQAATPAELVDQMIGAANEVSQGLESVKDANGAKSAAPAIEPSAARFAAAKSALSALKLAPNDPAHADLYRSKGEQIQTAMKRLHNAVVYVRGIPGARRELRSIIKSLGANRPEDDEPKQ